MFRKSRLAGFTLLAVCRCAFGQEWAEQSILELFDRQSPMRREARAAVVSTVEAIRGRTLWPNPTAGYARETVGFNEFVQAEQQLPLSGRLGLQRKAMDPARDSMEAQGAARLWDARSSLRSAFYRALAAQEQALVFQSALTEIQPIIELLRVREREGEGSRYDRMRVEREAAELRADLALAQARERSERAVMLAYLPLETPLQMGAARLSGDLGARIIPRSREELIERALGSRAEIRTEASHLTQLSFEQQAADRLRRPEPFLTAGLKRADTGGNRTDTGAVIGISIPLPIFNKGQTEVARISAERERTQARRDLLVQQITAGVLGIYDVHAVRVAALQAFDRETGDSGAELLTIARAGYRDGELGILQLLDAYRLARLTSLRRVDLQAAVKEAEIELSRNAGFEVMQ